MRGPRDGGWRWSTWAGYSAGANHGPRALGAAERRSMGNRSSAERRWVEAHQASALGSSLVVGILVALLIAVGVFFLLVSQQ